MGFRDVTARLRRRWWILLIGFLFTGILAAFVHHRPPIYQAEAVLGGLIPPQASSQNPLVNVSQGELAELQAVANNLDSTDNQARLRDDGAVPGYLLSMKNTGTAETPGYGEPTVIIQADASDPNQALATVRLLMDAYRAQLQQFQTSLQVADNQLVSTTVNVEPYVADASGRPSQAVIGVFMLGLVFTIPFTLWCDTLLQRVAPGGFLVARRARRALTQDQ